MEISKIELEDDVAWEKNLWLKQSQTLKCNEDLTTLANMWEIKVQQWNIWTLIEELLVRRTQLPPHAPKECGNEYSIIWPTPLHELNNKKTKNQIPSELPMGFLGYEINQWHGVIITFSSLGSLANWNKGQRFTCHANILCATFCRILEW
jgi:hypothetical protein